MQNKNHHDFPQALKKFCELTIKKIDLEAEKSFFVDNKDYKSASQFRNKIKQIDIQLKYIVQSVRDDLDNSNVNQFNYHDCHYKLAFLEQFKTTNKEFSEMLENDIKELQESRKILLQHQDFINAAIMSEEIQSLKKMGATEICNFWNIKL